MELTTKNSCVDLPLDRHVIFLSVNVAYVNTPRNLEVLCNKQELDY